MTTPMAVRIRIENDPARPDAFPPVRDAEQPTYTLARERYEATQGVVP